MTKKLISYKEKIEKILGYTLFSVDDYTKSVSEIKSWLLCELLCGNISSSEYNELEGMPLSIAGEIISIRKMSYCEKIELILGNKLEYNGDHQKAIQDVEAWLCCEWQCNNIPSMEEYSQLKDMVVSIARRIIKEL